MYTLKENMMDLNEPCPTAAHTDTNGSFTLNKCIKILSCYVGAPHLESLTGKGHGLQCT